MHSVQSTVHPTKTQELGAQVAHRLQLRKMLEEYKAQVTHMLQPRNMLEGYSAAYTVPRPLEAVMLCFSSLALVPEVAKDDDKTAPRQVVGVPHGP